MNRCTLLVFNWQYCERKQSTDSTRMSVYRYICVYRAEMADHLRTLPNLFYYFPGLGDDVRPCVTHHPRHLHAVPSGSVQQNMELLFNIQHIIRLLFNAQNKFNICETKLKFMHTPYIYVHQPKNIQWSVNQAFTWHLYTTSSTCTCIFTKIPYPFLMTYP